MKRHGFSSDEELERLNRTMADANVYFGIACAAFQAEVDKANQAFATFGVTMMEAINNSISTLSVNQRYLYEQLIASGECHFEALEEAKRLK